MAKNNDLGRFGEALAADYLTRLGLQVVDRNWRCPAGEIDIVARDGRELVIVEVKTRSTLLFGDPLTAVTEQKRARLWRLAAAWRQAHPDHGSRTTRVDVIGVLAPHTSDVAIDHLRNLA